MMKFNTFEDYKAYVKDLSLEQLREIESNINREAFPGRYNLVRELIEENPAEEKDEDEPEPWVKAPYSMVRMPLSNLIKAIIMAIIVSFLLALISWFVKTR